MSLRWKNILLSLSAASLLVASCAKKTSSDNPLPTSYRPSVIISSDNNVLYGIDPTTGKKNWEYALPFQATSAGLVFKPTPLLYNEMIYQPSPNWDTIYKINSETGALVKKILLYDTTISKTVPIPFSVQSTPIADANLVYLTTTNGSIYAFDTGTYKVKWSFLGIGAASIISSPVIYQGNVYFASTGGYVYCLDKTTGPDMASNPIWVYPGANTPTMPSIPNFISSPSICPPYLYVGSQSDSNMYCIYLTPPTDPTPSVPATGVCRWTYKTKGAINSSPTASYGKCIFGCNDFYVYCLDTAKSALTGSGGLIWKYPTTSQVNASPIISNQVVYIP